MPHPKAHQIPFFRSTPKGDVPASPRQVSAARRKGKPFLLIDGKNKATDRGCSPYYIINPH